MAAAYEQQTKRRAAVTIAYYDTIHSILWNPSMHCFIYRLLASCLSKSMSNRYQNFSMLACYTFCPLLFLSHFLSLSLFLSYFLFVSLFLAVSVSVSFSFQHFVAKQHVICWFFHHVLFFLNELERSMKSIDRSIINSIIEWIFSINKTMITVDGNPCTRNKIEDHFKR